MKRDVRVAVAISLLLHVLMLWLLPVLSGSQGTPKGSTIRRLQVTLLPGNPVKALPPLSQAPQARAPRAHRADKTPSPRMIAPPASQAPGSGAPNTMATADSSPVTVPQRIPLDLTLHPQKTPGRSARVGQKEWSAAVPDPVKRSFEQALQNTSPLRTEVTEQRDDMGGIDVKVRTSWGTYCLRKKGPPSLPYDTMTLPSNCP